MEQIRPGQSSSVLGRNPLTGGKGSGLDSHTIASRSRALRLDNAGVGQFEEDSCFVIKGETHNSPSNLEAYGGSLTGIVGVYRDPLGTGRGSRLIAGLYGYCVGPRDYAGPLKPRLHPRRLLDGVIEGVKDGGNKSGIPTTFGQVIFDTGYLGKCLVFVTAVGIMPARNSFAIFFESIRSFLVLPP